MSLESLRPHSTGVIVVSSHSPSLPMDRALVKQSIPALFEREARDTILDVLTDFVKQQTPSKLHKEVVYQYISHLIRGTIPNFVVYKRSLL